MLGAGDAAGVGLEQPQELAWQDEEGALPRTMPLLSPPAPSPFLSCHLPSFWRQQAKLEPSPQIQASQGSPAPHSYSFGAGPLSALPSLPAASPRGQGDAGRLCWARPPTTVPAASPHHSHRGLPSTLAFWERGESQHPTGAEGRGGWSPLWGHWAGRAQVPGARQGPGPLSPRCQQPRSGLGVGPWCCWSPVPARPALVCQVPKAGADSSASTASPGVPLPGFAGLTSEVLQGLCGVLGPAKAPLAAHRGWDVPGGALPHAWAPSPGPWPCSHVEAERGRSGCLQLQGGCVVRASVPSCPVLRFPLWTAWRG